MSSQSLTVSYSRTKGIVLVLTAAVLWGVSGTVAQYLFHNKGFTAEWLVVTRLLLSGVLLLAFAHVKERQNIWRVWQSRRDRLQLVVFAIVGMLGVQYTYFAAIKHGNAATATLLQYVGPVFITAYLALRLRRLPARLEVLAILLSILGTFLLVTHGSVQELAISGPAFFWGITSAVALAFYTLYPISLLHTWGSTLTVGWGMLLGGLVFSILQPPWQVQGEWSYDAVLAIVFVIICGTIIAFYCYLESLKYLSASETSLLACAEPLTAALLAVLWLHVTLEVTDLLGALCIIATIVLLSYTKK